MADARELNSPRLWPLKKSHVLSVVAGMDFARQPVLAS